MNYPLVSLILFCFNQEKTVSDAVNSCLQQDYGGPLEIILSDDCSADSTHQILETLAAAYNGKHTVRVRRNPINLGIGQHYNVAIAEARGELIFTAAGDDISLPHRISAMTSVWIEENRIPDLITSDLIKISEDGEEKGLIRVDDLSQWDSPDKWISKRPYVVGAAHAFTKRMHERFGNFISQIVYEDQIMSFRMTLGGRGIKVNQALVKYRVGGVSQSPQQPVSTGENYLEWSRKKFSRQAAQYAQIKKDLERIGRLDLWRGKIRRRYEEAVFVMSLHGVPAAEGVTVVNHDAAGAGMFFKFRQSLLVKNPKFAIWLKTLTAVRR